MELEYWHWLVFGLALLVVEIFLPSFTALWFGAGAIVVGGLLFLFPDMPIGWQIFAWTILSAILTWAWFKYLRPMSKDKTKAGLAREAIVGQSGQVVKLPVEGGRGELRFSVPLLGAEEWDFVCDSPVQLGDRVWVIDVIGNALLVEKRD